MGFRGIVVCVDDFPMRIDEGGDLSVRRRRQDQPRTRRYDRNDDAVPGHILQAPDSPPAWEGECFISVRMIQTENAQRQMRWKGGPFRRKFLAQ
jgi:hypothetical protein